MTTHFPGPAESVLLGRADEVARLESLLRDVRAGHGGALVITGEPGVGKTALLERLAERAAGCRVRTIAGIQAEAELAFAAVQQLCGPLLGHIAELPEPLRDALDTILGLRAGVPPDPFLLSLAVLTLLDHAASDRPLVCVVDDAQWLDRASAQILGFVARRLDAEPVALVFARRDGEQDLELAGIPEMAVRGLRPADAHGLLTATIPGPMDVRVRERIVAETRGNPLAIIELPRAFSPTELAGGFSLSPGDGLTDRIEESFQRRIARLSHDQRLLALVAAADPIGDPGLVRRAGRRLGIPVQELDDAAFDGLLQWGPPVTFRHPLVRSAVYRSASGVDRRRVHRALAAETDGTVDADHRAWHRAEATLGLDEDVADELERSARRAQGRGGYAAAAAFLERAVALTPDNAVRATRELAAADAKLQAGAPEAALRLVAAAQAGPLAELDAARADLLRAQIAYAASRGTDAPPLLLRAARRLEPLDLPLARDTYLDALASADFASGLVEGGMVAAAEAARRAPALATPRPWDGLLDGLATLVLDGYGASAPVLRKALVTFRSSDLSAEDTLRWTWLATRTAVELWDYDAWRELSDRMVQVARQTGAAAALPPAFALQTGTRIFAGELDDSAAINEESDAVMEATGIRIARYGASFVAAWRGRESEALAVIDGGIEEARSRGEGFGVAGALVTRAIFHNGTGRHREALADASRASADPEDLAFHNWGLVELVEAATRVGDTGRAAAAVELLAERTSASGSDWALGVEARCRALVSDGDDAERMYRQAISHLGRTRVRVELARAHLFYGEWLRRRKRRTEAREQLRTAYGMLAAMGAEGYAERARRELLATGETAPRHTADTASKLTSREAQVARMARDGLSNPEIGTRLFLSPRTVEYHLRHVFLKLGVTSRVHLHRVL